MKQLTIDELHELWLIIFDNAESLHKEAKFLFEKDFYARAYLLAYFACEELGKLPIIVGIVGRLIKKEPIDWNKALKRLRDHKSKVDSDDFHQYVFGREPDLLADSDIAWLKDARSRACTHKTRRATRPLFPQKLTFYSAICMSALCPQADM